MAPIPSQALRLVPLDAGDAGSSLWSAGAPTSTASSFKPSQIDGAPSAQHSEYTQLGTTEPTKKASLYDVSDITARLTVDGETKSVSSRAQTEFGDGGESAVVDAGSTLTGRSGETDDELRHRNCDPLLGPVIAGCSHVKHALNNPIPAEEALEHIKKLIPRKGGGGKSGGGSSSGNKGGGSPSKPGSGGNGGSGSGGGGYGYGSGNAGSGDSSAPDAESEKKKTKTRIMAGAVVGGAVVVLIIAGSVVYCCVLKEEQQEAVREFCGGCLDCCGNICCNACGACPCPS